VDLNALVAETATLLRRVLGENIELQVRCSAAPLPLHADRGMIDLVLLNLAVNARDAMPEGGTLIVETVREERAGQALARLDVRDSGKGIPAEILPRIFEPFFTTKDVGKGTGLGLATVFGIVQEHGGTIEVDSQPGRGTAFRVFFPLSTRKPAADQGPRADGPRGGTETLLLAEDDPSVRSLMVGVLSRLGYRVLQATSGVEALEVARAHAGEIALVVTDLVMPGGISGLELGRRIAAAHPLTKVVYTSGFSTELAGTQIVLKENVNFLPKPFSPWALARVVRERLDEDERLPGGSA
jgi:CheY-like chemotaxis protein